MLQIMNNCFKKFTEQIGTVEDLEQCFRFGLEREALRVQADGKMSTQEHPAQFGEKTKNPHITTDYAENQLELITGVHTSPLAALQELEEITAWAQQAIPNELLWPFSMPPNIPDEDSVVIAKYPDYPEKEIYRNGLATRYGKIPQTVCGVHFNFSCTDTFWNLILPPEKNTQEEKNKQYMALARNFLRIRHMLVYAYGASPVVGNGYPHKEDLVGYCPISIRMSRYGYSNTKQRGFLASFNSVEEYAKDIRTACTTSHPDYEKIGLEKSGKALQLNTNILQLPSEYYAPVRVKPSSGSGVQEMDSLEENGIQRLEFRTLDTNPFEIHGICAEQLDIMFLLLLDCLCKESPLLYAEERSNMNTMQRRVALCGRKPGIYISCFHTEHTVEHICDEQAHQLQSIASWLDALQGNTQYTTSLHNYCTRVQTRDITAEKIMKRLSKTKFSHHDFGLSLAKEHHMQLLQETVSPALKTTLESYAQ